MKKLRSEPNEQGFWGDYGGRFVAETLIGLLRRAGVTDGAAKEVIRAATALGSAAPLAKLTSMKMIPLPRSPGMTRNLTRAN